MSDANYIASALGLNVTGNTLSSGSSLLNEIRIVALPPDLQNLDDIQHIEGRILSVQKDGLVMISTEHGNVTISTNNPALLQNKSDVELRIDAGNPPTKIALRPTSSETSDASSLKKFDTHSARTTLTESAKKLDSALLAIKQLLSGTPIPMRLFGSEETIAQPFIRKMSSGLTALPQNTISLHSTEHRVEAASAPYTVSSLSLKTVANESESSLYNLTNTRRPDQEKVVTYSFQHDSRLLSKGTSQVLAEEAYLPPQSKLNEANVPFRAIAVHVIGTSDETRISYSRAPQTSASANQGSLDKTAPEKPTPNYTVANHAEIRVRSVIPPQIGFVDNGSIEHQMPANSASNLHFSLRLSGDSEPSSSAIYSPQIGRASAVVEGFTQTRNLPVIRMLSPASVSERLYSLDVPVQDLLMGCQLECEITPLQTDVEKSENLTGVIDKPKPAADTSHFLTLGKWPVMEEIQQSLIRVNPQTAQAFNASLPSVSTPAQFGAGILFFVAAMRSGDLQSWLGDKATDALKRSGKGSLLGQVGSELSGISQMNKERVSGEWRALSVPLVWQNEVHKLAIYTNHGDTDTPDNDAHVNKGDKTRFIVDLSLSNIGPLQLDGLFSGSSGGTPREASGRLDLVLRTEHGFSKAMKQQMRSAYKNALDETHITGELSFQDHTLDWVRITPNETAEYSTDA